MKASTRRRENKTKTAKFPLHSEPKLKCGSLKHRKVSRRAQQGEGAGAQIIKSPEGFQHRILSLGFIILFFGCGGSLFAAQGLPSVSGPVLVSCGA